MKTAEEYVQLWRLYSETLPNDGDDEFRRLEAKFYREIQLDAMKEGMRRAANCAINDALMNHHDAEGMCICGNCSARRAILTAAEQLTEKDL